MTACECGVCSTTTGNCDPVAAGTPCASELADAELPCEATECDGMGSCVPTGHCDGDDTMRLDTTPGVNCADTRCASCGNEGEECCVSYAGRGPRMGCMNAAYTCDPFPICLPL